MTSSERRSPTLLQALPFPIVFCQQNFNRMEFKKQNKGDFIPIKKTGYKLGETAGKGGTGF